MDRYPIITFYISRGLLIISVRIILLLCLAGQAGRFPTAETLPQVELCADLPSKTECFGIENGNLREGCPLSN